MKKCSKCRILKETSEFYNDKHRKDGKAHRCKSCDLARRTPKPPKPRKVSNRALRDALVVREKLSRGCENADCGWVGEYTPEMLHFDHIDRADKVAAVSKLRRLEDVEIEIRKCRVLCANCHASKTKANKDYLPTP